MFSVYQADNLIYQSVERMDTATFDLVPIFL